MKRLHPDDALIVIDETERLEYPEVPSHQVWIGDCTHRLYGKRFANVYVSDRMLRSDLWRDDLSEVVWVCMARRNNKGEQTAIYRASELRLRASFARAIGDAVYRVAQRLVPKGRLL